MTAATVVVARSLADRRRAIVGYGIGLGLMIVWVMAVYPSIETELGDYVDAMPEAMRSLFGMEEISSLAGFVHAEVFTIVAPLVFLALAITTGARTIAGEERDRILPVVLATGVGRRNLVLAKAAALAIDSALLAAITLLAVLVGLATAGGGIGFSQVLAATVQLAALGLLFGTFALAVGAATGRAAVASATAVGVALATYLVDALANLIDWLEPLESISPFHWYLPNNPLVEGWSLGGLALLVASTAALAAVGVVAFERRDLGV